MEVELDSHLSQEVTGNSRNGKSQKTIKTVNGSFDLRTPHDRDGSFSPQLVKKHQTTMSDELKQKILALYCLGMSYKDISAHVQEMYGVVISTGALTDKILKTFKR